MNVKLKQRIYSQSPKFNTQKHKRENANYETNLLRSSSHQNQFVANEPKYTDLDQIPKIKGKRDFLSHQTKQKQEHGNQSLLRGKMRRFSKRVSQHKLKPFTSASLKSDLIKYQMEGLINQRQTEVIKVKLDLREKNKRHKQKRKLIHFTKGNNHSILREIFVTKYKFIEAPLRENAHICWLQSSSQKETAFHSFKMIKDDHLPDINKTKCQPSMIYNYLDGQSQLTNKEKLYRNMRKSYPQSIGTYIPKSFIVDFKQQSKQVEQSLLDFIRYFFKKEPPKKMRPFLIKNYFMEINIAIKQLNKLLEHQTPTPLINQRQQDQQAELEKQKSLWILKPTSLNRGRGIHLFSSLKQLSKLLSQNSFEISVKMYNDNMSPKSYIIQEYIQRPLLIDGFKFDIRMWVYINIVKQNGKKILKAYLFQHGYSRLASVKYDINLSKDKIQPQPITGQQKNQEKPFSPKKQKKAYINNRFIHLTNNAVQKDAKDYGQFCEGNQLSVQDTVKYFQKLDSKLPISYEGLLQNMKRIVFESINSVKQKLVFSNSPKTFQLLGYDFLLDQNLKMWLIEVNCNPCLEQSSQLLGTLLRQMLSGLVILSNLEESRCLEDPQGWIQIM